MFAKYTLLFSKRTTIFLYIVTVVFLLFVLIVDVFQTTSTYLAGTGFDITANQFASETLLFFPFYVVTGLMMRLLIERARTFRRTKRLFHIAEYTPQQDFSPAMAGLLIDNDIRKEEVIATLYDLQARGIVEITDTQIIPLTTIAPVTAPEKQLLNGLFASTGVFELTPASNRDFVNASDKFSKAMREEMRDDSYLPMPRFKHAYTRRIITGSFLITAYVAIVLVGYILLDPNRIFQIGYPRYPMTIWQPIFLWLCAGMVLAIGISGFCAETFGSDGVVSWRYVAGYRLYIGTVFKGKFGYDSPKNLSRELQGVLPYAIAFGIEKGPVELFIRKFNM